MSKPLINCDSMRVFGEIDSRELYRLGYALPMYTIGEDDMFRFEKQYVTVRRGAVPITFIGGWPAAKWADVLRAAI